jgi:hypothetical protein
MERFYVVSKGSKAQKMKVINLLAKFYKLGVNCFVVNSSESIPYTYFYPYDGEIHAGHTLAHTEGAKEISIANLKRMVLGKSVKKEYTRAMEIDGVSYILKSWQIDAIKKIVS